MNHDPGRRRTPVDVIALAELDADLPEPVEAARRRAAAAADPDAAAVLDALAATRAELAGIRAPEVPTDVAERWAAALADEAAPAATTADPHGEGWAGPRGRGPGTGSPGPHGGSRDVAGDLGGPLRGTAGWRRRALRVVLAAAALAAVVGTGLGALRERPEQPAPVITGVELVAVARAAVGTMDVGALADPAHRRACLRTVVPEAADEALLGGRRVVLDGRSGVLLVLATETLGRYRIVAVAPGCGPSGGILLAEAVVG